MDKETRERIARMEREFVESNPSVSSLLKEKARKSEGTARMYTLSFILPFFFFLSRK